MRPSQTARILPIVAAVVGTFIFHRYSLLTGLDRVQADTGDSRFVAFLLEHWNNALHGRAAFNSPPIFWPERNTLAYSELAVGMGALHTVLRTGLDVFPAMNLQLILLSLGTFAAAYLLLVRGFRLTVWGATAGAYFFAFSWPRFAQLVHIQLQFTALLPILALLALECLRDGHLLRRSAFLWRACGFVALARPNPRDHVVLCRILSSDADRRPSPLPAARPGARATLGRSPSPDRATRRCNDPCRHPPCPDRLHIFAGHAHQPRSALGGGRQLPAHRRQPVLDGPREPGVGMAVRALARRDDLAPSARVPHRRRRDRLARMDRRDRLVPPRGRTAAATRRTLRQRRRVHSNRLRSTATHAPATR